MDDVNYIAVSVKRVLVDDDDTSSHFYCQLCCLCCTHLVIVLSFSKYVDVISRSSHCLLLFPFNTINVKEMSNLFVVFLASDDNSSEFFFVSTLLVFGKQNKLKVCKILFKNDRNLNVGYNRICFTKCQTEMYEN